MNGARISHVQIRMPCVMLVRVDPGGEPEELRVDELPFPVLRVRHPLPACTRVGVMRPAVILVGRSVKPRDFVLLMAAADDVGAAVILLGSLVPDEGLHEWVIKTACFVQSRREALARAA